MGSPVELDSFSSPSYRLESQNAASSKMVNMFPEKIEEGPRAGKFRLRQIPGMVTFCTLPTSPLRCLLSIDSGNRLFAIAGTVVYEVFSDGTYAAQTGTPLVLDSHPALMVSNGFQLLISSGQLLYILNGIGTGLPGVVSQVFFIDTNGNPDPTTPVQAGTITFLNNYFIADQVDSKAVYVSNLAPDGGIWDPADVKIKEGYPDNVARVYADNQQLWVFGFESLEPWTGTGDQFPFQRTNDVVLSFPCSAPYSVAGAEGRRFWLGNGVVYGAYGLEPERISDYGVELAIKGYGNTSDAEGWCYIDGGHVFYVISFPTVGRTWVYDLSVKAWHERGLWNAGQWGVYRGRVYARAFTKDLVGDPASGKIYQLDPTTYTDAGGLALRRQRICPYINEQMRLIRHSQLTVDCDTGVGLNVASDQLGYDPQLIMRWSDDRGETWSSDRQASLGRIGQTKTRVIYNNNGSSRIGRAYEFVVTDPVPWNPNTIYLRLGAPEAGR